MLAFQIGWRRSALLQAKPPACVSVLRELARPRAGIAGPDGADGRLAGDLYVRKLLAERRQHPQDDLWTALSQAEESGDRSSEDEQVALNLILERRPKLRLAVPAESLRWRATPVVRGLASLPLQFGP